MSGNDYRVYGPDDGDGWESLQALEDNYWAVRDRERQGSGECPWGHRDRVIPVPADLPQRREGHGDWWCEIHEIQFGLRR